MINPKVVAEIRRAVARKQYEIADAGRLYLTAAKAFAGGVFEHSLNGGPWELAPNLLPTQGRNFILDVALGALAKQAAWYMAPFATNTAPIAGLTAANFAATQGEFKNYTAATRALWTPDASANGVQANTTTGITITIDDGTTFNQFDMYGLGLISSSAKGATTGFLAACALFLDGDGDPRPRMGLVETDVLGLRYTITLTSS